MEFGAGIFFTDYSISPAELAAAPEEQVLGKRVLSCSASAVEATAACTFLTRECIFTHGSRSR
jgi:hypothetical protein